MIRQDIYLRKYKWDIRIFYAVTCYKTDEIISELRNIGCDDDIINRAYKSLNSCDLNMGLCYSNNVTHETIIVIGLTSNKPQFMNSLHHEIHHCATHIAESYGLSLSEEEVCYIAGSIAQKTYPVSKLFLCGCNCCKGKIKRKLKNESTKHRKN